MCLDGNYRAIGDGFTRVAIPPQTWIVVNAACHDACHERSGTEWMSTADLGLVHVPIHMHHQ